MSGKKTGIYIAPINEAIIEKVMADYGYTKLSNALNFIVQEYARLIKEDKKEVVEQKVEEKIQNDLSDWFIAEEK